MKLTVFPGRDLPAEMRARWSDLQAGDPALASPYFRPEFTAAVAGARDDVFVAVLDGGAAFFPFQRGALSVGTPVGGPLSDYHGVIGRGVEPRALLRACGLRAWDFDHLPAEQAGFAPWKRLETNSPVIDLTQAGAGGSAKLREQCARRHRKLAREVGEVTLEMHTEDDAVFRHLLAWKSAQYRVSGEFDIFATPWIRKVVETIRAQRDAPFAGSLAVLRAGGRPVAAHFGMRSGGVLHYWFPAYDAALGSYSPGTLLLLAIIDAAPAHGIRVIDLGKGGSFYKDRLANRAVPLWEGSVVAAPWLGAARSARTAAEGWVRRSPFIGAARRFGGWVRQLERARRFR